MKRSAGILLPVFSLPSPFGIGTLGKAAYNFIDFLKKAGQSYWQMLPLGPTVFGDSPYQTISSVAGNPYYIDLELLVADGLLSPSEIRSGFWGKDAGKVDYKALYEQREPVLRKAFRRSAFYPPEEFAVDEDFRKAVYFSSFKNETAVFRKENAFWLEDYALYMALKSHFGMKPWYAWEDEGIRRREPGTVVRYRELLWEEIAYHVFLQYEFYRQWEALREYGRKQGISFIGDLPIYVPLDSVEVWVFPELFQLDENRRPRAVAGVPPDAFSRQGQLWGSPLYDWGKMEEDGYGWWMERIAAAARLFDVIRIDHFRGLESYWAVPYGASTAMEGEWLPGPGIDFLREVRERFPELSFIAEDLGFLTAKVRKLVKESGFPGMKVLQFAFEEGGSSEYLPHRHTKNSVVYTGTHDNNTLWGWILSAPGEEVKFAKEYLGLSRKEGFDKGVIRGGMSSVADLFIAQMQDYLELSGSARINVPGTVENNWCWRMNRGALSENLAKNIAKITARYERCEK